MSVVRRNIIGNVRSCASTQQPTRQIITAIEDVAKVTNPKPFGWIIYRPLTQLVSGRIMECAVPVPFEKKSSNMFSVHVPEIEDANTNVPARILVIDWRAGNKKDKPAFLDIGFVYVQLGTPSTSNTLPVYDCGKKQSSEVIVSGNAAPLLKSDLKIILDEINARQKAVSTSQKTLVKEWNPILKKHRQNEYAPIAHFSFLRILTGYPVLSDKGNVDMMSHMYNTPPEFVATWWQKAVDVALEVLPISTIQKKDQPVMYDIIGVLALQMAGKKYPTGGKEFREQRGLECVRAYSSMGDCDFMALTMGSLYEMLRAAYSANKTLFAEKTISNQIIKFWMDTKGDFFVLHAQVPVGVATASESKETTLQAHAFGVIGSKKGGLKHGTICEATCRNLCKPLPKGYENPYNIFEMTSYDKYVNIMAAYTKTEAFLTNMPGKGKMVPLEDIFSGKVTMSKFAFSREGEFSALVHDPVICINLEETLHFLESRYSKRM